MVLGGREILPEFRPLYAKSALTPPARSAIAGRLSLMGVRLQIAGMQEIAIQISPEAKGAYFADYLSVARSELAQLFGPIAATHWQVGPLEYLRIPAAGIAPGMLLRLSFAQGLYAVEGELLRPLDLCVDFRLHEDFVFGSKFRGKTNERLTQLLLNVGLAAIGGVAPGLRLLDPMCGRATTLLWALRYGMDASGIEQDAQAIDDIHRHLKKWCKLHRQKHTLQEGFLQARNRQGMGRYLDFAAEGGRMRVAIGDARQAALLAGKAPFDLLISDLPYGVQHLTPEMSRNPLPLLAECAPLWRQRLRSGGALVLAFNSNNPKREALSELFVAAGFEPLPFAAPHRMSESIVRDVLILRAP